MKKILFALPIVVLLAAGCNQSSYKSVTSQSTLSQQNYNQTTDWQTYTNSEYGFQFNYPSNWTATSNSDSGPDYKVIAKIVNPNRAGKQDTDIPVEQFLVRSINETCEGKSITIPNKTATDSGWGIGLGNINYRSICIKTEGWPITLDLSAFDQASQTTMDEILSTFKFTSTITATPQFTCDQIADSQQKDNCFYTYYKTVKQLSDCDVISNSYARDNCIAQLAINIKLPDICNNLKHADDGQPPTINGISLAKFECIAAATGASGDINSCNKLFTLSSKLNSVQEGIKANCLTQVAIYKNDLTICKLASAPYDQQCITVATKEVK